MSVFFSSKAFAVVGASADRSKYGNKVLRWYIDNKLPVTPINPKADEIEGLQCKKTLSDLPSTELSISVITPPQVSLRVLEEAARLGIRHIWFQPGSEPEGFRDFAAKNGIHAIGNGPCILIEGETLLSEAKL
ncbi:hypothetical protein IW140_002898 [Coemansia sp. RSA 1813]|nr:hypothetical protein EV178_002818 [Coemansia sp. RSA 1646]KAJ1771997.1 hypothetical protein LPJ74_001889 [Coemansia sp. RSA 1843]KAJ2089769.1 hypothetical protein IW138_003225 [Coemansia sp. RSA 986]KAJ2210516.1 hypothetical protein EV179_006195 [Coemansia sp. RSA 487]KAJ2569644.1 hypothetical protein IW140_002898 [Coemansia sp. RSA 1813]